MRFHWAPPFEEEHGHYTAPPAPSPAPRTASGLPEGQSAAPAVPREPQAPQAPPRHLSGGREAPPERRPRQRMASFLPELFAWMQRTYPGQVAPPPAVPPRRPWGIEEGLRLDVRRELGRAAALRQHHGKGAGKLPEPIGHGDVHDLEQGHRPERGGTRVSKGLPDLYFRGHGIRGWIETKRWDNVQTSEQVEWMLGELEAGGVYLLVYEVGQIARWYGERVAGVTGPE